MTNHSTKSDLQKRKVREDIKGYTEKYANKLLVHPSIRVVERLNERSNKRRLLGKRFMSLSVCHFYTKSEEINRFITKYYYDLIIYIIEKKLINCKIQIVDFKKLKKNFVSSGLCSGWLFVNSCCIINISLLIIY